MTSGIGGRDVIVVVTVGVRINDVVCYRFGLRLGRPFTRFSASDFTCGDPPQLEDQSAGGGCSERGRRDSVAGFSILLCIIIFYVFVEDVVLHHR